jgi:7-carboxy-7-deazaguanine synthase
LVATIAEWCEDFPGIHHSISITGGEPLVDTDLLLELLPKLRKILPISLETNGTLPDELEKVIDFVDHVSMDIKLQSSAGAATQWDKHQKFLEISAKKDVQVKIVVSESTTEEEINQVLNLIIATDPETQLILQPVTIQNRPGICSKKLLHFDTIARSAIPNVRTIPQTHLLMGVA